MEMYLVYIEVYMVIALPMMILFLRSAAKIGFIESYKRLYNLANNKESDE
jgi:hypothetical protein